MVWAGLVLYGIYTIFMGWNELYFHRKRVLEKWEKTRKALVTFSLTLCLAITLFVPYEEEWKWLFFAAAGFSILVTIKDEFRKQKTDRGREEGTHAVLFMLHPLVLILMVVLWPFLEGMGLFAGIVLPF